VKVEDVDEPSFVSGPSQGEWWLPIAAFTDRLGFQNVSDPGRCATLLGTPRGCSGWRVLCESPPHR
jgi:hypothetical protein